MFETSTLLRFDPFIFPDGGQPKSKYFIVIKNDESGVLLASLPTSKDHVPSDIPFEVGCLEIPERNVNVFVFGEGQQVTSSFCFPRRTFIYGAALKVYPVAEFERQSLEGETVITDLGKLEASLFATLIECLKNSDAVRGKFKKMM